MLEGKDGIAKQRAIEKLAEFGEAVGAEVMVPIVSAHIFPPERLTKAFREESPEFIFGCGPIYDEFAALDAKVSVLTTTEPGFIQLDGYKKEGYPWSYRDGHVPPEVRKGIGRGCKTLDGMGVINSFSCVPYLNFSIPKFGEYHAWCESNAACFANSIVGAKTNRETTTTAFYSAIAGVHPKYGVMCDRHRKGQILFELEDEVRAGLKFISDWMALGGLIGMRSYDKVPVVDNLPRTITNEQAKAICSCASPALNYPMMNLVGISPEAPSVEAACGGKIPSGIEKLKVGIRDIRSIYETLCTAEDDDVDIVTLGCPFLTIHEIREIAGRLSGRRISGNVAFWIQTDFPTYLVAKKMNLVSTIEKAGGKIYHST